MHPMRSNIYFDYNDTKPPTLSTVSADSADEADMRRRNSEMDDSILTEAMNEYLNAKLKIEAEEMNYHNSNLYASSYSDDSPRSRDEDSGLELGSSLRSHSHSLDNLSREYAQYAVSNEATMLQKNPWLADSQYGLIKRKVVLR